MVATRGAIEAGLEYPGEARTVCTGSPSDCQAVYLEPGKIYRVEATVEARGLRGPEALYEAIKRLYEQYPGVYLSYVRAEQVGKNTYKVVMEVFDPPVAGYSLAPWALIAILALIVAALVAAHYVIRDVQVLVKEVVKPITEHPVTIGIPLAVLALGAGAFLLASAGKRR